MSALLLSLAACAADPAALPADWHGLWRGELRVTTEKGETHTAPMELDVRPLDGKPGVTWAVIYGAGEKRSVRPYELLPVEGKPGRFVVDEKNGCRIEARLFGNVLTSQFRVEDSLITARYERRGGVLLVEMTTFSAKAARTDRIEAARMDVTTYPPVALQAAELRREPPK